MMKCKRNLCDTLLIRMLGRLHSDTKMSHHRNDVRATKSSSKARIAACLLMILAMAERGGFEPPVEVLAPTTV